MEQLNGARVSDGFFRLTYGLWERNFGRDGGILGRKITVSGKPYTVVGVLPQSFRPLPVRVLEQPAEIYRPLTKEFSARRA